MHLFHKILDGKATSADQVQTAPSEAVWSGSALSAYAIVSDQLVYIYCTLNIQRAKLLSINNEQVHLTN